MSSKWILFLCLIFSPLAYAAEEFSYRRCPDGSFAPAGQEATRCPKVASFVMVNPLGQTTATVVANTEGTDGNIYIYLQTADTPRRWNIVANGRNATKHSGAIAVSAAGSYSYGFTGLSSATTYYGKIVYVPTSGRPSRIIDFSFKTTDGSAPSSTLTGRFIDCASPAGGNGTTSATSGANRAWSSIEDLEQNQTSLDAGTDIWIKMGCTFAFDSDKNGYRIAYTPLATPSVLGLRGTVSDQAIIGGYYLDPANSNAPTASWEGSLGGRLQWIKGKPNYGLIGPAGNETLVPWKIQGANTEAEVDSGAASFSKGFMDDCSSHYDEQLIVESQYVTVRSGEINGSSCGGIWFGRVTQPALSGWYVDKHRGLQFQDFKLKNMGGQGWYAYGGIRNMFVSHVTNDSPAMCWTSRVRTPTALSNNTYTPSQAHYVVDFTSGGTTQVNRGDIIQGAVSGKKLRVEEIDLTSGSWAAGTAAGVFHVNENVPSGDMTASEQLNIIGPSSRAATNVANVGATVTTTGGVQHRMRVINAAGQCGLISKGDGSGPLGRWRKGSGWTGGGGIASSINSYSLIEALSSYGSGGEGIIFLRSSHATFRGVIVSDSHSGGLYMDGSSDVVIDGGIFTGNRELYPYPLSGNQFGSGISFGFENIVSESWTPDHSQNNIVRNSIIVNNDASGSRTLDVGFETNHRADGSDPKTWSAWILNNAFIGMNLSSIEMQEAVNEGPSGIYLSNNLIDERATTQTSICHSGTTPSNNLFTKTASNTAFNRCKDAGTDVNASAETNPQISRNTYDNPDNVAYWQSLGASTNTPDPDDAKPLSGSPLLNVGNATWDTTDCVPNHTAYDPVWGLSTYPYALNDSTKRANFAKCRYYDRNGVASTTNVDIGPFEGTGTPATVDLQPKMTLSSNSRYLQKNGQPWMWVGCTGWLSKDITAAKITQWLEAEQARGCDVAQAGLPISAPEGGWPPYQTDDPICADNETTGCDTNTANPRMRTSWFSETGIEDGKIDWLVSETKRLGMFVAIPVMWGSTIDRILCDDGQTQSDPSCASTTRATNYATWLAQRYSAEKHIIWIVAGEYDKITWTIDPNTHVVTTNSQEIDSNQLAVLNAIATALNTYKHPDSLMTIHPNSGYNTAIPSKGSSRGHFSNASWLDFSMLQAGNNDMNVKNTVRDYGLSPVMPVVQAELNYESTDINDAEDSPWHVRMGAWTHVLSGGAGYTYGHSSIWDFNSGWEEFLPSGSTPAVGADDIYSHFKTFWATYHDESNVPDRTLITSGGGDSVTGLNTYVPVLRKGDSTVVIAYTPKGNNFYLNTNQVQGTIRARWFNPRTGAYTTIADPLTKSASTLFDAPGAPAQDNDYVLVLD